MVQAVPGDPYSLYLTWMPPTEPNGYIIQYNIYCQDFQLGSGGPTMLPFWETSTSGSELNATVAGLTPFTNYECFVTANTSVGEGNSSNIEYQTTDEFSKLDSVAAPIKPVVAADSQIDFWLKTETIVTD